MTPNDLKKKMIEFKKKICTCRKEWLDDDAHYANCPVFQFQEINNRLETAVVEEVRENVGTLQKDWPVWGRDTAPAEGDTTRAKDRNEGYNTALKDVLALLIPPKKDTKE